MAEQRIAIIGGGRIGEALLSGLLSSGWGDIVVTSRREDRVPELRQRYEAEAMIEAGILLGLSREISTTLVVQTMLGTAKQLRDEKMHPVELRESVTSPGGTTIAAIRELEQAGVRAAFLNAIQAAMTRAQELSQGG